MQAVLNIRVWPNYGVTDETYHSPGETKPLNGNGKTDVREHVTAGLTGKSFSILLVTEWNKILEEVVKVVRVNSEDWTIYG